MEMAHIKNLYVSRMLMSANLSNYQRDPEGMSRNGDIPRFGDGSKPWYLLFTPSHSWYLWMWITHYSNGIYEYWPIPMTSPWHPHGFYCRPSGPEATQQEAGHTAQDTGSGDAVLRGHLAMAQKNMVRRSQNPSDEWGRYWLIVVNNG